MINQDLNTKEDVGISDMELKYNKISKIFHVEGLLFSYYIGTILFIFIGTFLLTALLSKAFSFGIFIIGYIVGTYFAYIGGIFLVIFSLITVIRTFVLKKNTNVIIQDNNSVDYEFYQKFNKIFVLHGLFFLLIIVGVSSFWFKMHPKITPLSPADLEREEKMKQASVKSMKKQESERIPKTLDSFQFMIKDTQGAFVGYGVIKNIGDCVNPVAGSLFNPSTTFKPKLIKDPEWKNHSVINSLNGASSMYVTRHSNNENPVHNNMADARCFSDEDHYAYQIPNYFEDPYPAFYCVDDVHIGVQKNNKQIKGSNCEDVNEEYIPPLVLPEPDITYFK